MRLILLVCLNLLTFLGLFAQNNLTGTTITDHGYDQILNSTLERYHVFEMDIQKSSLDFENVQAFTLNTGIRDFEFSAFPNNLAVSYREKNLPHLIGGHSDRGEIIALTISDDFIFGYVRKGNSKLFIEPVRYYDKSAPRNLFVSYYDFDVIENDEHVCGVETVERKTRELNPSKFITDECVLVDYAIANTFDMVTEFGSVGDVEDFNLAVLNTVQENYRSEFDTNVEYDVVANFIPATAGADPFPSTNDAEDLLNDFDDWGNGGGNSSGGASGGFGINYQMAGLWTDRNIQANGNFGVIGVAYTPGWHHLLENFSGNGLLLQVMVSHEIGHNWDANHDASGTVAIMAPSVVGTSNWSSASMNDIDARINSIGYLDPCSDNGIPEGNFFQSTIITCVGGEVEFEDQSQYGATRDWEFDNGTPATSIEEKETVTFNTLGQHFVKITSTNGAGSGEFFSYVDVKDEPSNPCTPSGSGGAGGIVLVSLENVSNPSDDAAAAGRYEDFACEQIFNLEVDTDYDIIVGTQGNSNTSVRIYIDNNGDGDFNDGGELEANFNLNSGGANYALPFTTASSPLEDEILRFRIIHDIGVSGPCENPSYSQVEDYGVVFLSDFEPIFGCTDPGAGNFDPNANIDDGSCSTPLITWYRDFDGDLFGDPNNTLDATTAPNGYVGNDDDCNDADDTVFPGAIEVCDGQINNCLIGTLALNEVDNDGDGYVECNFNAATWAGSPSVIGGNDCDDTDGTVFPGAPERCDGQRNDCNFSGIPANEIDNDNDGYVECEFDITIWVGSGSVIGGDDCNDTDDTVFPGAPELCDGQRNNCNLSGIPANEVDNDNDGYVECNFNAAIWVGSGSVIGGNDCNDSDNTVYPGASELCDGQRNNCNLSGIPTDEVDNDNDGYVECNFNVATWVGSSSVIGGNDCNDSDGSVYPGAPEICDGQRNNCNLSGIPANEVDNDNDGYVECNFNNATWVGDPTVVGGNDCDDANNQNYPGNTEICDNQDNDCDGLIDEGCQPCDGVNIVINSITQNTTSAEETILSTALVDEPSQVVFFAGDEIELDNGFEVVANQDFVAEIEDCVTTTFASGGTVNFVNDAEVTDKLMILIDDLKKSLDESKQQTIKIVNLHQVVIFHDDLEVLLKKDKEELGKWFKEETVYIAWLTDGENNAIGKLQRVK